jgi:hypothetical protein
VPDYPADVESIIWAIVIVAIAAVALLIWRGDDGSLELEGKDKRWSKTADR